MYVCFGFYFYSRAIFVQLAVNSYFEAVAGLIVPKL